MAKVKRSFIPSKQVPKTLEWLWANEAFEQKYPALYELLAAGVFEGEPRKGATLTLFVSDGRLKASVADRHSGNALWLTLEPFEDVLAEVELRIVEGKEAWKPTSKNGATPVF